MNTMRDALNVVRYDWFGLRIGGRGASMRGLWPALIVASVLIFACFFILGRMTAGGAPAPETSSSQRIAHAAIPGGLHGGSPVAGSVPSAIVAPPVRHAPPSTTATETPASQSPVGTTATTTTPSVVSQSVSAPAPPPAPAQTSAPPTKSSHAGGERSSGGGGGGSSDGGSGGGGSFDSSG